MTRRTLPAMRATLLGFVAARFAFTLWVRPHPLASRHVLFPVMLGKDARFPGFSSGFGVFAGLPRLPNAWALSSALVDRASHALSAAQLHELLVRTCPTLAAGSSQNPGVGKGPGGLTAGASLPCLHALSHHMQLQVAYQPPSHYWPLQALETGIFLSAALALIGATVWRVGRRASQPSASTASRPQTRRPWSSRRRSACRPRSRRKTAIRDTTPPSPHEPEPAAASDLTDFLTSTERNRASCVAAVHTSSGPLVAVAAVSLLGAGCGGGSSTTAATTTTQSGALAYSRCIRSHGFPSFPDPTSSGQLTHEMLASAGINPQQPAVLQAGDACVSVTHGVITKAIVARFVAGS